MTFGLVQHRGLGNGWFSVGFGCFLVLSTIHCKTLTCLVGGIPSKPLHSACPSEEDAFIHCSTVPDAWCLVWIWFCTSAIPQNGVSSSPHVNFANQVRTKCFSLNINYQESAVYGMCLLGYKCILNGTHLSGFQLSAVKPKPKPSQVHTVIHIKWDTSRVVFNWVW